MSGNKHAAALSLGNSAVSEFLQGESSVNRLKVMSEQLKLASKSPDVRPNEAARQGEPAGQQPVQQAFADARPEAYAPSPAAARPQAQTYHHEDAAYVVDGDPVNRGGRPRHGKERKVERTVSMDRSLDKILERLGIIESLRLDRKVSAAEVAVHLMQYGLSQMVDNAVLPGEDGKGLFVRDMVTEVALPKFGG